MTIQCFENLLTLFINNPLSLSLALFFFFPFFLLWLIRDRVGAARSRKLLPSPPKLPVIGHLHYLGKLPHQALQSLSKKYGPLMYLQLGYTPTLVVSSAEMGREIMKTHDVIFSSRPTSTSINAFLYGGKGVAFAPSGKYWTQMRKICVMDLLSVKRVRSFRFVREEEISNMVDKIKQACRMGKAHVNLSDFIMVTVNNIVSRVAVGRRLEGSEGRPKFAKLVKQVVDLIGVLSAEDLFPSLGWIDMLTGLDRRMKSTSKEWHQFLDMIIEERLTCAEDDDRKNVVDLLLEAEKNASQGNEFTREDLRAIVLDIFAAGTDSTHTALEWAMAELANHPKMMKILQEEVRRVVGEKCRVDEDDINQMDYLNCVIKETLRLHPPVALSLPRVSTASGNIQGYHIPAKTRVLINVWAISRDPKIWDKPDEFIPERFVNNSIDFIGNNYEFIPFGAGRRRCPGTAFGIASIESLLASLVYWFDWELVGGAIDMTQASGISVHLKHPLHLLPTSHFSY